ncbi:MAG: hypothetical protein ACLVEV_07995 [Lachnospiraceae bacterium]|uniref:hypothetical protein n=1 Tax=Parablautia sp. Marseille-Q6255 TaxID=3039593 RepID=UPI0024BCF013|nr:hypothetical protein [Parablautia sp. Marseille-Q6255]
MNKMFLLVPVIEILFLILFPDINSYRMSETESYLGSLQNNFDSNVSAVEHENSVVYSSNLFANKDEECNLTNGIGFGFSDLKPGEHTAYVDKIFLQKDEEIMYHVTYFRTGLVAEVILISDDGTENAGSAIGGTGTGVFKISSDGWYSFGIRNSSENLQYKDTSTESLNISGTVVFNTKKQC